MKMKNPLDKSDISARRFSLDHSGWLTDGLYTLTVFIIFILEKQCG